MINSKYCNRCQALKPESDFGKNNNYHDGLQAECKQCFRDRYLERTGKKEKKDKWGDRKYC